MECISNDQILGYAYGIFGGIGITAGAHRLWAHRAYKANYKMRLILAIANLIAFQNCIFDWVNNKSGQRSIYFIENVEQLLKYCEFAQIFAGS